MGEALPAESRRSDGAPVRGVNGEAGSKRPRVLKTPGPSSSWPSGCGQSHTTCRLSFAKRFTYFFELNVQTLASVIVHEYSGLLACTVPTAPLTPTKLEARSNRPGEKPRMRILFFKGSSSRTNLLRRETRLTKEAGRPRSREWLLSARRPDEAAAQGVH
jgi:hypothetical protein